MTWNAPAKINLHLRVGPARSDGFHPLLTWMTTVGLSDRLTAARTDTAAVTMTCDDPTLPVDGTNLVIRAATSLGVTGVRIDLSKSIPHGGGLGGGSSDAAATLVGLNQLCGLNRDLATLAELAGQLGSDIPFFLHGTSGVCRGRGEIVTPVPPPAHAKWALLILPGIPVPTPAVYRKFDEMKLGSDVDTAPDWAAWAAMPSTELLRHLVNDLEKPAFALRPDLSHLRDQSEKTIGRTVRMSGSGSTLFSLFDTESEAAEAAVVLGVRTVVTPVAPESSTAAHSV
jgi:4-diphosphocytidyl-2-C-methyl-D-erythritol kinase